MRSTAERCPSDIDELTKLPGVGRKTANVIRGNVYGIPSIVVDTHVKRISRKLGITDTDDPTKAEFELMDILPEDHWILWNIDLITLGRTICQAQRPDCGHCFQRVLPFGGKNKYNDRRNQGFPGKEKAVFKYKDI